MNRERRSLSDDIGIIGVAAVVIAILGGGMVTTSYIYVRRQRTAMVLAEAKAAQAAAQVAAQAEKQQRIAAQSLSNAEARKLRLVAWNIESGGNDPTVIAKQLINDLDRYDIYGLVEVDPSNTNLYRKSIQAHGDGYRSIVTTTGGEDRMMIVYDSDRLEALKHAELESHDGVRMNDVNLGHRSPLMVRFQDAVTDVEFIVVLNHLARADAEFRQEQAQALRLWAAAQDLPVLGVGHYNFDFDFPTRRGNAAFDEFHLDYVWYWVEPEKLVDTNWSDRDEDGMDDYPHSCLDFTFVAGKANLWQSRSRVIVWDGDFPDDDKTSDNRPMELVTEPR